MIIHILMTNNIIINERNNLFSDHSFLLEILLSHIIHKNYQNKYILAALIDY